MHKRLVLDLHLAIRSLKSKVVNMRRQVDVLAPCRIKGAVIGPAEGCHAAEAPSDMSVCGPQWCDM
jgi:hypothetical protein